MLSLRNLRTRGVLALMLSFGLIGVAAAEDRLMVMSPLRPIAVGADGIARLAVEPALIEDLRRQHQVALAGFPMPDGSSVVLELERFEIFAPGATVIIAGAEGERHVDPPDVMLLRGRVAGDPEARVFLSISEFGTNGFIRSPQRTVIVASPPAGQDGPVVAYDPAIAPMNPGNAPPFVCGATGEPLTGLGGAAPDDTPAPRAAECRVAEVAVETDWQYTLNDFGGNATAALAYIPTLLGAVSEIYLTDIGTRLEITFSRVWSSDVDPYPSTGSSVNARLGEFNSHWSTNMNHVQRDVATMLTGLCGPAGGIAYLPNLCGGGGNSVSGCLNGTFPYPLVNNNSGNWDVVVVAHELGHNFNAPHTHSTSPQIDGCGTDDCSQASQGTIMSYCHTCAGGMSNIALTLQTRIINEFILPYVATLTSCMPVQTDTSIQTQPQGGNFLEGSTIQLTVGATGGPPLNYQWKKGGANLANGGRFSGVNTATLQITNAQFGDGGSYTVLCTGGCNSVLSSAAQVIVSVAPPTITLQPAPVTVCANGTAQFLCFATGTPPRSFRWWKGGQPLNDEDNLSGTSTAQLIISPVTPGDAGDYTCVVTNPGGPTPSNPATLTVFPTGGGDVNADGFVNGDDVQGFAGALLNPGTVSQASCAADMDGSGSVDEDDLQIFVDLLLSGP